MLARVRTLNCHWQTGDPQSRPLWRQWRYQLVALVLVTIVIIAIAAGTTAAAAAGKSKNGASDNSVENNGINSAVLDGNAVPSTVPSTLPTTVPSSVPSSSHRPSFMPSSMLLQTGSPTTTFAPTNTQRPTVLPSTTPSTGMPTFPPTSSPTAPTIMPTGSPTRTTTPTIQATLSPSTTFPPTTEDPGIFGFYLMGDTPYGDWEIPVLLDQLKNMTLFRNPHTMFTFHIGDFQKPERTGCDESRYMNMRTWMTTGPLPTFLLAGDNDWVDCASPDDALGFFRDHLTNLQTAWGGGGGGTTTTTKDLPRGVTHMNVVYNSDYPEMVSFFQHGILFVSIHLLNTKAVESSSVWDDRMEANIQWFTDNYNAYLALSDAIPLRAVIIFGHSQYSGDTREFFEGIAPLFLQSSNSLREFTPVLYFHGDGHRFSFDNRTRAALRWDAFTDVQVDQGAFGDPLIVEITTQTGQVMVAEHDLQYIVANGMIRIDRQRGRYEDPKGQATQGGR